MKPQHPERLHTDGPVGAGSQGTISAGGAGISNTVRITDGEQLPGGMPIGHVEVAAAEIIAAIAEGRKHRGRHRPIRAARARMLLGPGRMRRPTLYLAAALVGATGIGLVTAGGSPAAQAGTGAATEAMSVADALGLQAGPAPAATETAAVDQLRQTTASRAQRETEQAAAVEAQSAADQAALDAQAAAAAVAAEAARPKVVNPVPGARLSSTFGYRWGTVHAGIDLAAPRSTPEHAVLDGVVLQAGPANGFGQAVYIQHDNGDVTVYGHMDKVLVTAGQVVQAGDTIALMGSQGQSTGPHLHLEVHIGGLDGDKVDPIPWLAERGLHL